MRDDAIKTKYKVNPKLATLDNDYYKLDNKFGIDKDNKNPSKSSFQPEETEKILLIISDKVRGGLKSKSSEKFIDAINAGASKVPNKDHQLALKLWLSGVKGDALNAAIIQSKDLFNQTQLKQLLRVGDIVKALEAVYPDTTLDFQQAAKPNDEIKIQKLAPGESSHGQSNITLENVKGKYQVYEPEYPIQPNTPEWHTYQQDSADFLVDRVNQALDRYEIEIVPRYTVEQQTVITHQEPQYTIPSRQTISSQQRSLPSVSEGVRNTISNMSRGFSRVVSNQTSTAVRTGKSALNKAARSALGKLSTTAATALGSLLSSIAPALAVVGALTAAFIAMIGTILIYLFFFIFFVAMILFIINTGAYIVPPAKEDLTTYGYSGGGIGVANQFCEDGSSCPCGWPVLPYESEGELQIYQGAKTSGGSHDIIEAIDITYKPGQLAIGHPVTSRVDGIVVPFYGDASVYGNAVQIQSSCNGVTINLRYGHNSAVLVSPGQHVDMNQVIARSGDSGMGEAHVHYEFARPNPIPMNAPNIPKSVPRGCNTYSGIPALFCNVSIP